MYGVEKTYIQNSINRKLKSVYHLHDNHINVVILFAFFYLIYIFQVD